jgi:hypothetical protein
VVRGALRNVSGCQSHFYAHGVPWCFDGVWGVLGFFFLKIATKAMALLVHLPIRNGDFT